MLADPVFIKPAANTLIPLPFEHDAHTWRPAPSAICRERPLAGRGANLYWPHCRGEGAGLGVFPLGKWGQTWIYKYPQEGGQAAYSCILHSCILHSCCTSSRDCRGLKVYKMQYVLPMTELCSPQSSLSRTPFLVSRDTSLRLLQAPEWNQTSWHQEWTLSGLPPVGTPGPSVYWAHGGSSDVPDVTFLSTQLCL